MILSNGDSVWDDVDDELVVVGDVDAYQERLAEKYKKVRVHFAGAWIASHHGGYFQVEGDFAWCSGTSTDATSADLEAKYAGSNEEFEIEVDGTLEGPGAYGWLNGCSHLLHVERVVSIKKL
ncbi:MAG: hypothetical protein H6748_06945 [Spirochaetaceae bacterium]|nr:hypothetical protein [Spirochaetaceae bacterium]